MTRATVPETPEGWFEAGAAVFRDVVETLAGYGVAVSPELRFVPGDGPAPYYEPATQTIGLAMPDPATGVGRLYWLFAARAYGVDSVEAALEAAFVQLPWVVAHEVAHHLRHRYGAPIDNDFVEEQVCNELAVAFLRDHPAYRAAVPLLAATAERSAGRLAAMAPAAVALAPGYRATLGEVLVAEGALGADRSAALGRLAGRLGVPLDVLLDATDTVSDEALGQAARRRAEAEAHFNAAYAGDPFEYAFFGSEWLAAYLRREDLPTLGDALEAHVLTDDWERTRRDEARGLLDAMLSGPDDALAATTAEVLADAFGAEAIGALAVAATEGAPAVRAAALDALAPFDGHPAVVAAAAAGLDAAHPEVAAAAARLAFGGPDGARARAVLQGLLDGDAPARRAALLRIGRLADPHLAGAARRSLRARDAQERALAAAAAAGDPALAALIDDPADEVRAAAVGHVPDDEAGHACLVEALDDPALAVRLAAMARVRALGADGMDALRARVCERGAPWTGRALAARLLGPPHAGAVADALVEHAESLLADREALPPDAQPLRVAVAEEAVRLARLALGLAVPGPVAALLLDDAGPDPDAETLALEAVPGHLQDRLARALRRTPPASVLPDPARLHRDPSPLLRELAAEAAPPSPMLTPAEKLVALRAAPVFRHVPLADLRALCEPAVLRCVPAGQPVFDLGDPADALFVVTAGRIRIEQDVPGGYAPVATLAAGHAFGEGALFDDAPRSARAVAEADAHVLAVPREAFLRLAPRHPQMLVEVGRVLAGRLRDANADWG